MAGRVHCIFGYSILCRKLYSILLENVHTLQSTVYKYVLYTAAILDINYILNMSRISFMDQVWANRYLFSTYRCCPYHIAGWYVTAGCSKCRTLINLRSWVSTRERSSCSMTFWW